MTFLVGNPDKPLFVSVPGWGVDPKHTHSDLLDKFFRMLCTGLEKTSRISDKHISDHGNKVNHATPRLKKQNYTRYAVVTSYKWDYNPFFHDLNDWFSLGLYKL